MKIDIPVDITFDFFSHPTCDKCPLKGTDLCDHVPTCRMIVALRDIDFMPDLKKPRIVKLAKHTDYYALVRNRWNLSKLPVTHGTVYTKRRQYKGHLQTLAIVFYDDSCRYEKYYSHGEDDLDKLYHEEFMKLEGEE